MKKVMCLVVALTVTVLGCTYRPRPEANSSSRQRRGEASYTSTVQHPPQEQPASGAVSADFGVDTSELMPPGLSGGSQGTMYDAMYMMANMSLQSKEYRNAGALYERAIELVGDNSWDNAAKAHLGLARAYEGIKMYYKAVPAYVYVIENFPPSYAVADAKVALEALCVSKGIGKPAIIATKKAAEGFRGIAWGTKIETLTDMVSVYEKGELKIFRRQGDKLTIGKATLSDIRYAFWRGQFYSATIETKGYVNWADLRDATKVKYRLQQDNEYIEYYYMLAPETYVNLEYNRFSKEATLYIASQSILKEKRASEVRKAREAAKSDF